MELVCVVRMLGLVVIDNAPRVKNDPLGREASQFNRGLEVGWPVGLPSRKEAQLAVIYAVFACMCVMCFK